jgi:hypothetical protein
MRSRFVSGGKQRWMATMSAAVMVGVFAVAGPVPAGASPGQVISPISGGVTATDLVNTLLGGGITTSNVTYTGNDAAAGTFTGMGAIGFDSGVLLSTGAATDVVGPNASDSTGTGFAAPGDADLDPIVAPDSTADAAVLEFDFVPTTDEVTFEYVFASEEYNEYVNSEFNDVFAFFVNGSNCALVPGTSQAVAVNTVNGGNPFGTDATNPAFYRNNSISDPGPATIDTEMDGLTNVFTCAATVNADETNHMKLAIADTSDADYDSVVFIQALSLSAEVAPVCADQSLSVQTGVELPVTLTATDANPTDTITFALAGEPSNGTLTGTPPTVTYTSNEGFVGPDSFSYSASDGTLSCTGAIAIDVTAPPEVTTTPVSPRFTG